jgi:signal transduction histidine kinase
MARERSLGARVALAAALSASASAMLAAATTSGFALWLLQRAEDRRLYDAAVILADEVAMVPQIAPDIPGVVAHESQETRHTGMSFAVFDRGRGRIAGDPRIDHVGDGVCVTGADGALRLCGAGTVDGMVAVASAAHGMPRSVFALAAVLAALVAGGVAWLASRPISTATIAPLERLRARLSTVDLDEAVPVDLGQPELVSEVDQLRDALVQLLGRVHHAIDHARRFAANAAHELRTPLTAVRAELELLAEDPGQDATAQATLRRAERRVAELSELVERLLILAIPQSPEARAETVSVRDLLDDAVAGLAPHDRGRVRTGEADAVVVGDSVLLATMITNALSNGLKFGSNVEVTVARTGGEVVVRVDDDGPGVPTEERERVFEPFARTRDATLRRVPGHGLGLALVRHVAIIHGGSARFVDGPGPGARLEIRLPVAADPRRV